MTTIGDRIKKRRQELNVSQEELAKILGYKSRSSINKIEKDGRELPQGKILAIATALHTTPSYIMGWEEEPQNKEYYLNPETAMLAQQIHDDPNLRILLDASKDLEPEDIKVVVDLVKRMKAKERGDNVE